jgi:BirA family biotin operon repressor/biotin-[acetyl-CoA-carboxylase] ligase
LSESLEASLLAELRRAPERMLELPALADVTSASTDEARVVLAHLQEAGFPLAVSEDGSLSLGSDTPLHEWELRRSLRARLIGRSLRVFASVESTQDVVRKAVEEASEPGVVVVAEHQSSGRGRLGRRWEAPPGKNLMFSVAVCPPAETPASALTATWAVAVAQAIDRTYALGARIRWPNDVLLEGRKVAGILVEAMAGSPGERSFVIGTGVNVNAAPTGVPTSVSLGEVVGGPLDRTLLLLTLLEELDRWYDVMARGHLEEIESAWRARSSILGRHVSLQRGGQTYHGRVVDLSVRDGIILELGPGMTRAFAAEHVTLRLDG